MRLLRVFVLVVIALDVAAQARPRARDLGIHFDGIPGPLNAITDVAGVEVGMTTIIRDVPREGGAVSAARTGVTAILPRGKTNSAPVFAGTFALNANGEMTGTQWIEESGFLEGPLMITTTHSVGVVRDAVVQWQLQNKAMYQDWALPVVAETFDGFLNDASAFHVTAGDAIRAIEQATGGKVAEGNTGGGTGMICYEFKCGTGTASRRIRTQSGGYTVGVLVQANHGLRYQLEIAGVPVGRIAGKGSPYTDGLDLDNERGSIIVVVATDAPLLPHQLRRLARRASLGLARTGSRAGNGSGDIFLAFSTANAAATQREALTSTATFVPNDRISRLFDATVLATEEAIINALVAGETMTGAEGRRVEAISHDLLRDLMKLRNEAVEKQKARAAKQ